MALALALTLLLFLRSCHVLLQVEADTNIDPRNLPGAVVFIESINFPGAYLQLDCTTGTVDVQYSSEPNPALSKFVMVPQTGIGSNLDYAIQSFSCNSSFVRLDAKGGNPFDGYPDGFGSASATTVVDAFATFRPVPQLSVRTQVPSYSLMSDGVSYAYLRLDANNGLANAQNYIGPYEQLLIICFPPGCS